MSIKVVIFLEVKDFEVFSNTFNSDGARNARQEAGIEAEIHQGFDSSDEDLRWKRRHKKRKKIRRPQRGR